MNEVNKQARVESTQCSRPVISKGQRWGAEGSFGYLVMLQRLEYFKGQLSEIPFVLLLCIVLFS